MKCGHAGDFQQLPESEMEQKCPHSYNCPICEYDWPCGYEECHGYLRAMQESLRNELDTLLEGIEW